MGNISSAEVSSLVSSAYAFVVLIEKGEPFGLAIAESMACGTPVIGTALGSHNELIIDGVTGIKVSSTQDAARRFSEIRTIDRRACRERARGMFSLEKMISGYLRVYEKVLKSKKER